MKMYLLLAILILSGLYAGAQDPETVHAGENLSDHFSYLFPSFTDGIVRFKNGTLSKAKMNYNTFLCQMQFIESTGDTLVLSKPEEIDSVRLNDHSFFYNKGYYEIIGASDSVKLIVFRKVNVDAVVTGALGIRSHTVNVGSYDSFVTPVGAKKLVFNQDVTVQRETSYSLVDKNGMVTTASRSGFQKMFPNDKKGIETFSKSNKIDFKNEADLLKLFIFCAQSKA